MLVCVLQGWSDVCVITYECCVCAAGWGDVCYECCVCAAGWGAVCVVTYL